VGYTPSAVSQSLSQLEREVGSSGWSVTGGAYGSRARRSVW
jgi:DNA-binding transcriptional LysR family regulator